VVSERVTQVTGVILEVKMDTIVSVQKAIMLNVDQYGHLKARMKQLIRGINEDA